MLRLNLNKYAIVVIAILVTSLICIKETNSIEVEPSSKQAPDKVKVEPREKVVVRPVHFEIVGDTSHLFDEEDFKKVEVPLLYGSVPESSEKNAENLKSIKDKPEI